MVLRPDDSWLHLYETERSAIFIPSTNHCAFSSSFDFPSVAIGELESATEGRQLLNT